MQGTFTSAKTLKNNHYIKANVCENENIYVTVSFSILKCKS